MIQIDSIRTWLSERQLQEHELPSGETVRVRPREACIADIAFEAGEIAAAHIDFGNTAPRKKVLTALDSWETCPVLSRRASQIIEICIDAGRTYYQGTETKEIGVI